MKLLSTQRNSCGKQLICEDAVLDPSLMSITNLDIAEKIVSFKYDFSECGHPLNLPFDANNVDFLVKITQHDIHICAMVELSDEIYDAYEEYSNDLGDIEFDARMTTEEKLALLVFVVFNLLNNAKMATKENGKNCTKDLSAKDNEKVLLNAFKDIFPTLFKADNQKG